MLTDMRAMLFLAFCLTLFTVACTDAEPATSDADIRASAPDSTILILPGRQLGQIPVHARPEVLDTLLGQPYRSNSGAGTTVAYYNPRLKDDTTTLTIILTLEPDDSMRKNVQIVRTESPRYRDEHGLGVGSSRARITDQYPLSERLATYVMTGDSVGVYATGTGLTWEIDSHGTCRGLSVHDTRRTPSPDYRPDYPEMTREYPPVNEQR